MAAKKRARGDETREAEKPRPPDDGMPLEHKILWGIAGASVVGLGALVIAKTIRADEERRALAAGTGQAPAGLLPPAEDTGLVLPDGAIDPRDTGIGPAREAATDTCLGELARTGLPIKDDDGEPVLEAFQGLSPGKLRTDGELDWLSYAVLLVTTAARHGARLPGQAWEPIRARGEVLLAQACLADVGPLLGLRVCPVTGKANDPAFRALLGAFQETTKHRMRGGASLATSGRLDDYTLAALLVLAVLRE
jgi:hypothetical protein